MNSTAASRPVRELDTMTVFRLKNRHRVEFTDTDLACVEFTDRSKLVSSSRTPGGDGC